MPHPPGRVVGVLRDAEQADDSIGDHRQETVKQQRQHGGCDADAGNADGGERRHFGSQCAERRDEEAEQRNRRDGLYGV